MRQPMEDKVVTISRAKGSLTFSANFQLIAAMNPCPCGNFGSQKGCGCALAVVPDTKNASPVPLPDSIDIHIEVPSADYDKLSSDRLGVTSETIRNWAQATRDVLDKRNSAKES